MALLSLRNLTLAFGGRPILDGASLQIEPGDRLCLMGRNGAGKSTLLKLIHDDLKPDGGEVWRQKGTRAALVSQDVPAGLSGTVFDVVATGMGNAVQALAEFHHVSHRLALEAGESPTDSSRAQLSRLEALHQELEDSGGWTFHQDVERVLTRLSLDPDAEFSSLSGGTKRRTLLAQALVGTPDLLLLDEPTNQLDIDTIVWLEEFLLTRVKTFLFVTHDRAFARRLANRVAELDRGRIFGLACGYDEFVERKEAMLEAEAARLAVLDTKLAQEEAWSRQGIKARRTRNEGRVRALQAMREERRRRPERSGQIEMQLPEAERSGRLVADVIGASFAYDDRPIIKDFTTTIVRGDRVGIIGRNGSGKTTLLRLLLGELRPTSGRIRHGSRLEIRYFDQLREQLDPQRSVWENVADGNDFVTIEGRPRHVLGYLRDFLFTSERAQSPVEVLSGGERNRLLLARLFTRPCNVLVMDEPTNDLDAETLDLLEDLLVEFSGTLLLVSHDRDFLDSAVTSTLAIGPGGTVREFVGGYDDWLRQTQAETATSPATPKPAAAGPPPEKPKRVPERPRKLTFKELRELEALPEQIERLEKERDDLHARLADPEFYRNAGATAAAVSARLADLDRELEAAFLRWDELETLRG